MKFDGMEWHQFASVFVVLSWNKITSPSISTIDDGNSSDQEKKASSFNNVERDEGKQISSSLLNTTSTKCEKTKKLNGIKLNTRCFSEVTDIP